MSEHSLKQSLRANSLKNLKPWTAGQSGNPSGRTRLPEELRFIKSLTQIEVCKLVSKYARMTVEELHLAKDNPKTPVLELAIVSIFETSTKYGDYTRLSFLLDRAIGKAPVLEETSDEAIARQEIQSLSDHELLKLVKDKFPELGEHA